MFTSLLLMCSFRSYMVTGLIFRCLIYFSVNFCVRCKTVFSFILFHVTLQFPKTIHSGDCFPHHIFLSLLSFLIGHNNMGLFLGSKFCSIGPCVFCHRLFCHTVFIIVVLQFSLKSGPMLLPPKPLLCSSFSTLLWQFI